MTQKLPLLYLLKNIIFSMAKNCDSTKIQGGLAIASFCVGTLIACVCLFVIDPLGDIETSAISLVSEFLILCGALLGAKVAFDLKLQRFEGDLHKKVDDAIERAEGVDKK